MIELYLFVQTIVFAPTKPHLGHKQDAKCISLMVNPGDISLAPKLYKSQLINKLGSKGKDEGKQKLQIFFFLYLGKT